MGKLTLSSAGALTATQAKMQSKSRFFIIGVDMPEINIIAIGDHPTIDKLR